MKKIAIAAIVITILLIWNFAVLSQRPDQTESEENQSGGAELTANSETDELAKKFIIQEQESRENLRRLAEGQVKSLQFGQADSANKQVFVTAIYDDQTQMAGRIDYIEYQGKLYYTRVTNLDNLNNLPGEQVAILSNEEIELGKKIVEEQGEYQDFIQKTVNGQMSKLDITNIIKNDDARTLEGTAVQTDGTTQPFKIEMVFQNGFWYVQSMSFE